MAVPTKAPTTEPQWGGRPAGHQMLPAAEWRRIRAAFALSPRELEVVHHIFDGHGTSGIAYQMGVKTSTILTFIKRIYTKTGARDHRELVLRIFHEHLNGKEIHHGSEIRRGEDTEDTEGE